MQKLVTAASLAGVMTIVGCMGVANASPADPFYDDNYWGGVEETSGFTDNVAGAHDDTFEIYGADVSKTNGDKDLTVVIYTNYAADYQQSPAELLNTNLGALFIGFKGNLDYYEGAAGPDSGTPHYTNDTFADAPGANPGDYDRFSYAFDFTGSGSDLPTKGVVGDSGAGALFELAGDGSDVVNTSHAGTNRNYQAYDVVQDSNDIKAVGTWSLGVTSEPGGVTYGSTNEQLRTQVGTLTFSIKDFFSSVTVPAGFTGVQTSLVLAWTMSCGNDVMLIETLTSGNSVVPVPVPAGLGLLLLALLGLGFVGRSRSMLQNRAT